MKRYLDLEILNFANVATRKIAVVAFLSLFVFQVSCIFPESSMACEENDLICAFEEVRKENKETSVDVSDVVKQRIKIGSTKEQAISFLVDQGFAVQPVPPENFKKQYPDFDEVHHTTMKAKPMSFVSDFYQITLFFKNGVLEDVKAWINLIGP